MKLQIFQAAGTVFHLIPDIEFLLRLKLSKHIVFFRHCAEPLLVPGNHIPGNIPFHGRLISVFKMNRPIHAVSFGVPVCFAFPCVKIHLINAQIVHAEGMEHLIAPLLKLPDQVTPFERGYDKVRRSLEHI